MGNELLVVVRVLKLLTVGNCVVESCTVSAVDWMLLSV